MIFDVSHEIQILLFALFRRILLVFVLPFCSKLVCEGVDFLMDHFGHHHFEIFYFENLAEALGRDFERMADLENEWRSMFAMAWADFNRFLNGWSPGHWKLTPFSQRMTDEALRML